MGINSVQGKGKPAMDLYSIQGGVCYQYQDKWQPDGLLGWYADLTTFVCFSSD